jgi:hypothetical protein
MKYFENNERLPFGSKSVFVQGYNNLMQKQPLNTLYDTNTFVLREPDSHVANAQLFQISLHFQLLFTYIESEDVVYLCGPISVNEIGKKAERNVNVMATFTSHKVKIKDFYKEDVAEILDQVKMHREHFFRKLEKKSSQPAPKQWWEIYLHNTKLQIIVGVIVALYIVAAKHVVYFYKPEVKAVYFFDALKHFAVVSIMDLVLYTFGVLPVPILGDRMHSLWVVPLGCYIVQQFVLYIDNGELFPFDVESIMEWLVEYQNTILLACDFVHLFM